MRTPPPCDDLKASFTRLSTLQDVADILGITGKALRYQLYSKQSKTDRYIRFDLRKKAGGVRPITAPTGFWKTIQSRLNRILQCVYEPKPIVHGFTLGRSILTNARPHVGRRWVLNADLADFFPTINFGRVRGMFMAHPYKLPATVATILAQIVSSDDQLPQGSPTSPTVSNMLCARLDSHMGSLARACRCTYTRYADDLTLSTDQAHFPRELAERKSVDGKLRCIPGSKLRRTVSKNGFELNLSKLRLQKYNQRQEVTGLVTNERVNVPRSFVREIRAILHDLEKNGAKEAQRKYEEHYAGRRNRKPDTPVPPLIYVIKGKIEYLGMVRGKEDDIYYKYMKKLDSLVPDFVKVPIRRDELEAIIEHLWLINADDVDTQGTGFLLRNVGVVTASHVLGDDDAPINVSSADGKLNHVARVIYRDRVRDIAVLDIGTPRDQGLERSRVPPKLRSPIILLGFPNHNTEDSVQIREGHVAGFRNDPTSAERLILLNASIIYGNSGGPVLDSASRQVIGVALRGATNQAEAQRTEFHAAMPISAIDSLGQ